MSKHRNGDDEDHGGKRGRKARGADTLDNTRDNAREAARRTMEGIESNPMSVLVGGVAVGIVAGLLLPRSERERNALQGVGQRLAEGASAAATAAKTSGKEQLGAALLTRDGARDGVTKVLESIVAAARDPKSAR